MSSHLDLIAGALSCIPCCRQSPFWVTDPHVALSPHCYSYLWDFAPPSSSGPTSIGRKELSVHLQSSRGLGLLERECWLSSVGSGTLAWYQFSQAAVSLSLEMSSSSRHPLHLMNGISRIDGKGTVVSESEGLPRWRGQKDGNLLTKGRMDPACQTM